MLILIGAAIVFGSMLGGFILAGGNPIVLLHISEFVVIFGMAMGVLVIASPGQVMKELIHKIKGALGPGGPSKADYVEMFKGLYELFMVGRRNGLIALEEHVMSPEESSIFKNYPVFTKSHERMAFLLSALKPVIDGRVKPDQLGSLMAAEVRAKESENTHPLHVLHLVGDSMPGIGIVAAVLGIINTMGAIADGPEAVGHKVAAALTGTFLGIFAAYGFVNPLANRVQMNDMSDIQTYKCIMAAVVAFAQGMAPLTAIEVARRSLESGVQPDADELEETLKSIGK